MSIVRIPYPNSLPTVTGDYQAQNALIYAAFLYMQHPVPVVGGNIVKGAVFNVGGTVYQATADTAISGTPSAYVKLSTSDGGATMTAAYVADLSGVAWSDTYAGYYDGSGNLYVFDEANAIRNAILSAPYHKKIAEYDENGWGGAGTDLRLGRLRHLLLDNTTDVSIFSTQPPALHAWSSPQTGSGAHGIPSGAKGIRAKIYLQINAAGSGLANLTIGFSDNNANVPDNYTAHPVAGCSAVAAGSVAQLASPFIEVDIPLNSTGKFYIYTISANNVTIASCILTITPVGFYMGD